MTVVIVLFFFFILIGLPIGVTLGVAGVAGLLQIGGENFLTMAPTKRAQERSTNQFNRSARRLMTRMLIGV